MPVDTNQGYCSDLPYPNVDPLSYNYYHCSQQTLEHVVIFRNGPSVDTEKAYKCSKCVWIVKDSLKPQIPLLKITSAWAMRSWRPLHLWEDSFKFLTCLEGNKYKSKKQVEMSFP